MSFCAWCGKEEPVNGPTTWGWVGTRLPEPLDGATHQLLRYCPDHVMSACAKLAKEREDDKRSQWIRMTGATPRQERADEQ